MTTEFCLEQRFTGTPADVEAAMVDPDVLARMEGLPNVTRPVLLEQVEVGDTVRQRVRYAFTGRLAPGASAVVEPGRLTWVQETVLRRGSGEADFVILPDHYADRLRCAGTVTIDPEENGTTCRRTRGTLTVRFPFVGHRVERAIVAGLQETADAEAQVVQAWLDDRG